MSNWSKLKNESALTSALVVLCQDYVLFDDEFSGNKKIKKNVSNATFWIELAHELRGNIETNLRSDQEGYDEIDWDGVSDNELLAYIMDIENRFALNDIICQTIESWLKHFGKR